MELSHIFKGLHDFFHMPKCPLESSLSIQLAMWDHLSLHKWDSDKSPLMKGTKTFTLYPRQSCFISTKRSMKHALYDKGSFRTFHIIPRSLQIYLFCQRGAHIFLSYKKELKTLPLLPKEAIYFPHLPRGPETFSICLRSSETCYIC